MSKTAYTITGKNKLNMVSNFLEKQDKSNRVLCVGGTKYELKFIEGLGFKNILISNNSKAELKDCEDKGVLFDITEKPPEKIGKFDIVIFMEVIEHLINPDQAIVNINKLLKKGGLLILTTPNLACFYNRLFLLLGWSLPNYTPANVKTGNPLIKARISTPFRNSFSHKSVFTPKQLKELLNLYGFKILKSGGFHYGSDNASVGGGNYARVRKIFNKILPASLREGDIYSL